MSSADAGRLFIDNPRTGEPAASKQPDQYVDVLYVDDSAAERDAVQRCLHSPADIRWTFAQTRDEVERLLAERSFDLVVSELRPWGGADLQIFDAVQAARQPPPVVILTACGSEALAVEALRRGARDYLTRQPGYLDQLAGRLMAAIAGPPRGAIASAGASQRPAQRAARSKRSRCPPRC